MAKIKIKGYSELIDVDNSTAQKVRKQLQDSSVEKDSLVNTGRVLTEKSNIVAVFLDEDKKDEGLVYKKQVEEYYKKRNELLTLNPRERAEQTSWNYFKLFYWGIYNKVPDENLKRSLLDKITKFFEENPKWSKSSISCFMEFLNLGKDIKIDRGVLNTIERVESRESQDISDQESHFKLELNLEEQEENALKRIEELGEQDEIKAEDIPF